MQLKPKTITAFTTAWNCRSSGIIDLIDYYLNYIKVDKFIYLDDHSTDGTIDSIKAYKSLYDSNACLLGEDNRLQIDYTPYDCYSEKNVTRLASMLMNIDSSDVFIWVDSDEYLYHPTKHVREIIEDVARLGKNYISTRLTNVYNFNNTYDNTKTLLSQLELFHTPGGYTNATLKVPVIIKDSSKRIIYGGSNHYPIINHVECIDNQDKLEDTLYLLHSCFLTDQFYIDRKIKAKTRLKEHNIYITALDDNTGWWSRSLEDHKKVIEYDKTISKSAKDFFNL
jgi:hypothetical protein